MSEVAGNEPVLTQAGEEFKETGKILVASRPKNNFASSDKALPVITPQGVRLTRKQADFVLEEAEAAEPGLVFEVTEKEGE